MLLDQVPEDVDWKLDHSVFDNDRQIVPEDHAVEDPGVKYTVDDLQSDRGTYILDARFKIGMGTVSARAYFVRREGEAVYDTVDTRRLMNLTRTESPTRSETVPRLVNGLEARLTLARNWIDTCFRTHTPCGQTNGKRELKFARILDVGDQGQGSPIRLVERTDVPEDSQYLTLSHCWGGLNITQLRLTNHEAFGRAIDTETLPQTFRDAIHITRLLSIQYLWIDSLCIIQDSDGDWQQQATQMGTIYHNSWCNLAATAAKDGRDGLLRFLNRHPHSLQPLIVEVPDMGQPKFHELEESDPASFEAGAWRGSPHPRSGTVWQGMSPGLYECIDRDLWFRNVSDSTLGHRAWIVQERLLPPRVLHFGRRQLFWECNALKACELYPGGLPAKAGLLSTAELKCQEITSGYDYRKSSTVADEWNTIGPSPRILQSWRDVVDIYSRANLTHETDKLAALAGLASLYAERISAPYLGGLWAVHLPRQLMWAIRWPSNPVRRPMAPSWSWASTRGELRNVVDIGDTITKRLASIEDLKYTGDFLKASGRLVVKGRLIPCVLSYDAGARIDKQCNPVVRGLERAAFVQPDTDDFRRLDLYPRSFFCLPFVNFYDATEPSTPEVAGLVLEASNNKGEFQRFGAFRTNNAMDRDGDRHPDWMYDETVQPRRHTQFGRVFLMDVGDELAEVDERFYLSYESNFAKRGFANYTIAIY